METTILHRRVSVLWIFFLVFQIFGPIISGPPVAAGMILQTFPNAYQLTSNTISESNLDATSYNGIGYVAYERNGSIYMKQGIGSEEVVASGSSPTIEVVSSGIHIIYFSEGKIKYTLKSEATWSSPIDLTSVINPTSADFKIDQRGYIHLVYSKNSTESYDDLYYSTNTSGSFVESNFCHGYYWSGFGGQYCGHPVGIQVDNNNYFHIAYKSGWRDSTPSYSTQSMAYYTNAPSGNAGSIGFNWNTSAVTTSKNNIMLDNSGNIYIAYGAGGNRYLGKIISGVWNEYLLGSGFSDYSLTFDNGTVGYGYNDGSNNLNYIYDTGGGFGSAETVTTGAYPVITFSNGEKFFYNLQHDGSDDEVWLHSMNSVYTVPGKIDTMMDSFILANGGTVEFSNLEVGGIYMLMDGSTIASSGVLIATQSTGNLQLNPSNFLNYGNYTLTLSGSYGSTTTPSIASQTFYIGPVDYQDIYVNQVAPLLLSGGISTNLGDVTYANVESFSGLYFEKTDLGKISFASSLDLTNSGTISFLQNLPSKLDMQNGIIGFDPTDSDFANYGAQLSMYFDTGSTFVTGINDPGAFVVRTNTGLVLTSSGILSGIVGACGVGDPYCTLMFDTAHFTTFDLRPVLTLVSIQSNNAFSGALARNGDRLILEFTASEALTGSSIGFDFPDIDAVEDLGGNRYRATSVPLDLTGRIMPTVSFSIWPRDLSGNVGDEYSVTTDGSAVNYDIVNPSAEMLYNPSGTGVTAGDIVATLGNPSEDIVVTNNSGSVTYTFTENGSFTFEYRDLAGNTGSTTATVTNINKSVPVITINGSGTITLEQNSSYTELGANWSDETDGTGTVSILSGSIDTSTLGAQQMEYLYVNSLGMTGSTIRTVNIVDTTPPIAPTITTSSMTTSGSTLPNITGTGEVDTSIYLYKNNTLVCGSNTVNGSGTFVIVNFSSCLSLEEGTNTFTAYARDPSGNTSGTGNTITITRDSVPPEILYTEVTDITNTQANLEFAFQETHFVNETAGTELYQGATLIGTGGIAEYSGNIGYTTFSGLSPDTTYSFVLSLTDDAGNTRTVSGSFTTTVSTFRGEVPTDIYETGGILFGDVDGYVGSGNTFGLGGNNYFIYSDPDDSDSASGNLTLSGVDIIVLSGSWNGILLPPSLLDNDNPLAASGSEFGSGVTPVQTVQAGAEGASLTATGGYFWISFQIPGYPVGTVFSIYRSEDGTTWIPVSPDSTCTLDSNLMCTFRTDHLSLFAPAIDSTPDAFSFTSTTNAELNTLSVSNTITVSGINTGSVITITGGEYQVGTGSFTSTAGLVYNGDTITVRLTSSNAYSTAKSATLDIGGVSDVFTVTTKSTPTGGSSGGGGGGTPADYCPNGDASGNLYDGKCAPLVLSPTSTGTTTTSSGGSVGGGTLESFNDINDSFAREYIEELASLGIVSGYSDGGFHPNSPVTRAEWIKMVMRAFDISLESGTVVIFTDIPEELTWVVPYINTAKKLGIVNGQMKNGKLLFRPNDPITRAEALKMVFEASGEEITSILMLPFVDTDFATWMLPYIIRASELGIVNGQWINGQLLFRPNDPITRAEAAKILVKFLYL